MEGRAEMHIWGLVGNVGANCLNWDLWESRVEGAARVLLSHILLVSRPGSSLMCACARVRDVNGTHKGCPYINPLNPPYQGTLRGNA